jgi:PLD-like domain
MATTWNGPLLLLLLFPVLALAQPTTEESFSPHQGATALIVRTIGDAQKSIRVAAYSFTSKPLTEALIDACNQGVDVRIVFDKSQRTNRLLTDFFGASCVQTRIDDRYAIMHDKFIIIDGITLETGSFNFTQAAENKNAENVLVIHGAPQTVASYVQQWKELWEDSRCVFAGHLDERGKTRMTFHRGGDVTVLSTAKKIALPMTGNGAVLDFCGPFPDGNGIDDLSANPRLLRAAARSCERCRPPHAAGRHPGIAPRRRKPSARTSLSLYQIAGLERM